MASSLTSPAGDELDRLRQQYDRLCDVMTRTAESDPLAAERVLGELQALSQRILALESGDIPDPQGPTAPGAEPSDAAAPETSSPFPPPPEAGTPPAVPPHQPARPAAAAPESGRAAGRPSRIVAFRVSQGSPAASPNRAAGRTSWRLDAPPAPPEPASDPQRPAIAPDKTGVPAPAAGVPRTAAGRAAETPGNAVVFSSAIRHWLERHRDERGDSAAGLPRRPARPALPAESAVAEDEGAAATSAQAEEVGAMSSDVASDSDTARELSRLAAAVEQQALQIERILTLCTAHQETLEALQRQLAAPAPPPPADDPRVAALGSAVEEQRQRITALAKSIHNLAQWLAAQRGAASR